MTQQVSSPSRRFGSFAAMTTAFAVAMFPVPTFASEAAPPDGGAHADSWCHSQSTAAFCQAVRGVRAEGWPQQSRSEVMARNGMVTTSQPLAAQAGLQILMRGGNAVDAAIASAAALTVVEPMMVGAAGDLFLVISVAKERKVYVLNASGTAPTGATVQRFNSLGYARDPANWGPGSGMPLYGILAVTVPGSVWGWDAALQRFGKLTFKEVLTPAVEYAEAGFPISERIAKDWVLPKALPLKQCCTQLDPDSVKTWYVNERSPQPGHIFRNPEYARTLRLLQEHGPEVFYKGEIARAIVAKSAAVGGTMTARDLADYRGEWVEASRSSYRGHELLETPPPSQAWAANEALNILDACVPKWVPGQTLASLGPKDPRYWHALIEAKKLAYADLFKYNADPHFVDVPIARLLSKPHAESLCSKVDPQRASQTGPTSLADMRGDTVVLSTADKEGNVVALVNSSFAPFGSGVTVPGYGFTLHNRGALFSLDPASPNVIQPNKRPFNTLAAGMLMRAGDPAVSITLMGGDMQAQGHAQLIVNLLDLGANAQAATDMARFRHSQVTNVLGLESSLYELVGPALAKMGHKVEAITGDTVGGAQIIQVVPTESAGSYYRGGSDFRKDGQAVGW